MTGAGSRVLLDQVEWCDAYRSGVPTWFRLTAGTDGNGWPPGDVGTRPTCEIGSGGAEGPPARVRPCCPATGSTASPRPSRHRLHLLTRHFADLASSKMEVRLGVEQADLHHRGPATCPRA